MTERLGFPHYDHLRRVPPLDGPIRPREKEEEVSEEGKPAPRVAHSSSSHGPMLQEAVFPVETEQGEVTVNHGELIHLINEDAVALRTPRGQRTDVLRALGRYWDRQLGGKGRSDG